MNLADATPPTMGSGGGGQVMLTSTERKFHSLFCLHHKVIYLLYSPIEYGDLCLVMGKNITQYIQERVLWIINILKTLSWHVWMEWLSVSHWYYYCNWWYLLMLKPNQSRKSLGVSSFCTFSLEKALGKCSIALFKYLTDFYVENKIKRSLCWILFRMKTNE